MRASAQRALASHCHPPTATHQPCPTATLQVTDGPQFARQLSHMLSHVLGAPVPSDKVRLRGRAGGREGGRREGPACWGFVLAGLPTAAAPATRGSPCPRPPRSLTRSTGRRPRDAVPQEPALAPGPLLLRPRRRVLSAPALPRALLLAAARPRTPSHSTRVHQKQMPRNPPFALPTIRRQVGAPTGGTPAAAPIPLPCDAPASPAATQF